MFAPDHILPPFRVPDYIHGIQIMRLKDDSIFSGFGRTYIRLWSVFSFQDEEKACLVLQIKMHKTVAAKREGKV